MLNIKAIPMRLSSGSGKWGGLFLVAGIFSTAACEQKHPTPVSAPPPIVEVARPLERVITEYEVFTARTQAVQSVNIKARATGYLMKIAFKDGDNVKAGQVLFEIDKRPYQADLDKAKGAMEKLDGQKQYLDVQVSRYTKLVAKGAASQQELDSYIGQQAENVGAMVAARAQVQYAALNLSFCTVASPIDGRIDRHFLDVGDLVMQDNTLLTNIVSLKPTWAYFDVDQNTALRYQELVKSGKVQSPRDTEIPIHMGLGDDKGFGIAGVIDFVSNQLDPSTGSIRLRAVFSNDDGKLSAGLFGRIQVPVSAPHKGLLIRDQAIGTNQGEKYVLVVNESNVVEYRPVEVGQLQTGMREVMRYRKVPDTDAQGKQIVRQVESLTASDRVIVDGLQRVRPGATVNPKLTDMLTQLPEGLAAAEPKKK
jgi:RND family efflux transporter MFP subunit